MIPCPICEKHTAPLDSQIQKGAHATLVHYPTSDLEPRAYKGHLMIELHRHVTSPAELSDSEAGEVGVMIASASRMLVHKLGAEHVYVFTIGHLVPHLHFHIVPRYEGTPEQFWGGKQVSEWPDAPMLNAQEVGELARSLRPV